MSNAGDVKRAAITGFLLGFVVAFVVLIVVLAIASLLSVPAVLGILLVSLVVGGGLGGFVAAGRRSGGNVGLTHRARAPRRGAARNTPSTRLMQGVAMHIRHQVIVFDAADLAAEGVTCGSKTRLTRTNGWCRSEPRC